MIAFLYSISNLHDLHEKIGRDGITSYYFKYYYDYLQAIEADLDAHLAEDLWPLVEKRHSQEEIYHFMSSWYLDQLGLDKTEIKGFSFATIFNGTFLILLTSIAKYAGVFIGLWREGKKRNEQVIICYDSQDSLLFKVANYLRNIYGFTFELVQTNTKDTAVFEDQLVRFKDFIFVKPKYYKTFLFKMLRVIQKGFFKEKITRKVMVVADWTTAWLEKYSSHLMCIIDNSKHPINAWEILIGSNNNDGMSHIIEDSFQKLIDILQNGQMIHFPIRGFDFCPVFRQHAMLFLSALKSEILDYARGVDEAIDFYQPCAVVINYEIADKMKILASIARMRNIPVINLLDGYGRRQFFPFEKRDTSLLALTHFIEFSNKGKEDMKKKGIKSNHIHVVTAPVFTEIIRNNFITKTKHHVKDYELEVIILSLFPNIYDITWCWHSRQQYLSDVLNVCIDLGMKRVGVKLKNKFIEELLLKPVLEKYSQKLNVVVITGNAYDYSHYHRTGTIVGGVSTAMAEAAILGKKYFIFVPLYCGFDNDDFWLKDLPIASNQHRLKSNIENNIFFCRSLSQAEEYGIPLDEDPNIIKRKTLSELRKVFRRFT